MEQAHYWMWKKRKEMLRSHFQASMKSFEFKGSWEEKAFAEDAAGGALGGCIWPPRSYSCSFCKREFRSAQALGGHMNVHRKDRARLKQSLSPHHTTDHHFLDHHNQTQFSASDHTHLDPKSSPSFSASTLSLSRVSDQHEVEKNISREEGWICKRAKTSVPLSLPLLLKPCSNGRYSLQSEGYCGVIKATSMEDLDLELRLGDPPKVK